MLVSFSDAGLVLGSNSLISKALFLNTCKLAKKMINCFKQLFGPDTYKGINVRNKQKQMTMEKLIPKCRYRDVPIREVYTNQVNWICMS